MRGVASEAMVIAEMRASGDGEEEQCEGVDWPGTGRGQGVRGERGVEKRYAVEAFQQWIQASQRGASNPATRTHVT